MAKCELQIRSGTNAWPVAILLLAVFCFAAKAGTPRDDLLRLVPEDVGFCLVIQDLRGHSEAFLRSPFAQKLWESPIGMAIASAPEQKKLTEFEAQLKQGLGVTWSQLRDDVFGDTVVFAYRPGGPGKEDQEQGLMLVHARNPRLLADIAKRFNDIQKQAGDLKDISEREHKGVKYQRRVEPRNENFAYIHGSVLAFSTREAMLQQVIELEQKSSTAEPPILQHLRRLGADQTLASLWINPRAFDASFEQKAKQLQGPEASVLQTIQSHWKAVDGIALSATLKESEVQVALAISAQPDLLPAAARAAFGDVARPSDLWRAFPDNALLAVGGRLDAVAWNDFLSGLLPPDKQKAVRDVTHRFAAPALGKNIANDVLPSLGPDWGLCVLAPPPGAKHWMPDAIWALRIQPGGVDRALLNTLNSLALLAVFAYNGSHPDQISFHPLNKLDGGYLSNDQEFPAGFRPTFALKEGFLVLASSPEALERFPLAQIAAPPKEASSTSADIPLFRMSLKDLTQYLRDHQTALAEHIAKKNQVPTEDAARKLAALAQVCQLFNRIEISQRSGSSKQTLALRLRTAEPLSVMTAK